MSILTTTLLAAVASIIVVRLPYPTQVTSTHRVRQGRSIRYCGPFGRKALKSEKYSKWFCASEEGTPKINTRYAETKKVTKLKPVTTRTKRYRRSPLPYLTSLLN